MAVITRCDDSVSGAVVIPATLDGVPVGRINAEAFEKCRKITSVTLPDTVTEIGAYAFAYCYALKHIDFGSSLKTIGNYAFVSNALTSITLPESVTTVGYYAFDACTSVRTVTIGTKVSQFPWSALFASNSLETITVRPGNKTYHSANGCLIETATKKLIKAGSKGSIPDDGSVTSIHNQAFRSVETIRIPSSVTLVEGLNFDTVKTLYIDDWKSWCQIEFEQSYGNPLGYAETIYVGNVKFDGKVTIPSGVTEIKSHAFAESNVTEVSLPASVTTIGDQAFYECHKLTTISLPKNLGRVGQGAFLGSMLKTVAYAGSESDRRKITIDDSNNELQNATWTYAQ